jgi:PAS domain S-box-containing protein
MSERANHSTAAGIRLVPPLMASCVVLLGLVVLAGWLRDVQTFKSLTEQLPSMKANTALTFVMLGAALLCAWAPRNAALSALRFVCEVGALALPLATILEYAIGIDLGIDQILSNAPPDDFQAAAPGRMSIVAAACFIGCVAALLAEPLRTPRARGASRTLATCAGIVGMLALLGYLYGAPLLYRPYTGTTAMALHTAIGFILFAIGMIALHPEHGLPSIAAGRTLVGTHIRWLFPAAVLIPLLLGAVAIETYEVFGVARASIALTAAGTTILIGLTMGLAALWLRRMEDRLEVSNRALAATKQGVFIADGAAPAWPIVYVNDAFTQTTGFTARDAIGRRCDFMVSAPPDDPGVHTLAGALRSAESCSVTLPCTRRDGTVFSGRLSISAVPSSEGANHVVGLIEDVTGEQLASMARLELLAEASQARKDAEAANRVKDTFFASVTHELRSPLNACLMWLDVLALGPLSEKSTKGVEAIKRNLKIQTRLVNDLIDAAKISSGGIEIHCEPHELEPLLEGNTETWDLMAAAREVRFVYRPSGERNVLDVDPERLLQVLNNLLENAVRNTPAGGRLELRVQRRAQDVDIEIEDTGAGLSPEDLARVFTPFWRGQSGGQPHKGLGLGLAIAEHLVRGHRGTVSARSDGLGKGCVFTVSLPRSRSSAYGASDAARAR